MAGPVTLIPSRKTLFVGAYTRLRVEIDPGSGLTWDDLVFEVPDGLPAGLVSVARGPGYSAEKPTPMLLAGHAPGVYRVEARERASGTVVGELKYKVTDRWSNRKAGPSLWFSSTQASGAAGSAWGGGPGGPQNVNVVPASGTRRIAILFVDTSSRRYTTNATTMQGHRDRWLDEVVNGVAAGGVTRSSAAWYREVSYNGFTLSAQTFGPVQLPGSFTSYFNDDGTFKGSFPQACITAADGVIDYTQFDTILCVSRSVPATATTAMRSAWPYASIGAWGPYTTTEGNLNLGIVSMPNEWGTSDNREIFETFSHELGHNLGLGDQYTPAVAGRNPGAWEMMHDDDPLPHFSIAHRMMLGWVQPGWVRTFNFVSSGAPVDQTVTLSPLQDGAPPPGRFAGIEIRVADGLNYYLEYRNGENPFIGDRALPTDDRVLGTDVASPPYVPPLSRPTILLLRDDGNDDGAVLGNGDFYTETDNSDPLFPTDFRIDVSGINGSRADVRIRYGVNGRPDPSIRPWPAGPGREWQSPDIEVRNAKNAADPTWFNVPWVGNPNTVVAKVKNAGNLDAPAVHVDFAVKNFNIGGAPEAWIGSETRDVAAGATVEFSAPWTPPATGHYCVVVRIPLYQVPTALSVVEQTELNNLAQSNYTRFNTSTSSPSTREVTSVEVGNPYDKPTRVFLVANQTNPLYRTYLQHTWLLLEPGEIRKIRVMLEHALDPAEDRLPPDVRLDPRTVKKVQREPNNVGLRALIEDPDDTPRHALAVLGGAQVQVVTGRGTRFEDLKRGEEVVTGRVVTVDDGSPVDGQVIVTVDRKRGVPEAYGYVTGRVVDGGFEVGLRLADAPVRVEFLPPPGFGPCTSDWM